MGAARWTRGAMLALITSALAAPAWAEDIALVIGNRDYRGAPRVAGADAVVNAAQALGDADVTLVLGEDATLSDLRSLVGQFEQMAPSADGLLVVLAGRFIQGGRETFFLPVDEDRPGLTGLPAQSLALSSVLQILSRAPGEAILVLAHDGREGEQGPFLRDGIGDLEIPQGVTVVQGAPRPVADLLSGVLAVPGAALGQGRDVMLSGFLPDGHGFLSSDSDTGGTDIAQLIEARAEAERQRRQAERAERELERARTATRQAELRLASADEALWRVAQADDSVSAYQRYVDIFPDGIHAGEAGRLIRDIRGEPLRNARLAEEALSLSRDQRRAVQRDLTALGFNTRGIDGIFGEGTRSAIRAWQARAGQEQTGYLSRDHLRSIARDAQRQKEAAEAEERARQQEARRRDDAYWQQQGAGQDETGLRRYLERYARGRWAQEARNRLSQIEEARRDRDQDRRARERRAQDDALWERLGAGQSEDGLRRYLERLPRGRWSREARNRLEEIQQDRAAEARREEERRAEERRRERETARREDEDYWRKTGAKGTEGALRAYLQQFPDGIHAEEARNAIDRIRGGDVSRSEQTAWDDATRADTAESYRIYLTSYPRGYYAAEARARMGQLSDGTGNAGEQDIAAEKALRLNRALRQAVEDRLKALGFDVGRVDGKFDRATRRAITQYQRAANLRPTGYLSEEMVAKLLHDTILNLLQ